MNGVRRRGWRGCYDLRFMESTLIIILEGKKSKRLPNVVSFLSVNVDSARFSPVTQAYGPAIHRARAIRSHHLFYAYICKGLFDSSRGRSEGRVRPVVYQKLHGTIQRCDSIRAKPQALFIPTLKVPPSRLNCHNLHLVDKGVEGHGPLTPG